MGSKEYPTAISIRSPSIMTRSWLLLSELSRQIQMIVQEELTEHLRVCDIGCGLKPYYGFFKEKSDLYIGIDIDQKTSADVIAMAEHLPFTDNSFDVLLCSQALEHMGDPKKAIDEMYRVLKKDGLLIISTHGIWFKHDTNDYWRWTDEGLKKLMSKFDKVRVRNCGGTILCFFQILNLYVRYLPVGKKPFYLINNTFGIALDKLFCNSDLVINYVAEGRK